MNIHQTLYINRNSRKTRFAFRFVRALARIRIMSNTQPQQRCQSTTTTRRIKLAADASMATTIGSRRVWSRAVLLKLRSQTKRRALVMTTKQVVGTKKNHEKRSKMMMMMMMMKNKKKKKIDFGDKRLDAVEGDKLMSTRANKLRRLVPGGEAMDFCSLLEETAHYIKCLNTQVQVMKSIADIYTS